MNQAQKDVLEKAIADYRTHDAAIALAAAYPEQADLSVAFMGPMTGEQFILFADRVIDNFEAVILNGLWSAFPNKVQTPKINLPDLAAHVAAFVADLAKNDCNQAHAGLNQLIKAQLDVGIWQLAEKSVPPDVAEVNEIQDRLAVQVKHMEAARTTLQELLERVEQERKALGEFTAEKRAEFEEIRKLASEARQSMAAITASLEQVKKVEQAIVASEGRGKQLVENLNVQMGVITKSFDDFKASSEKLRTEINEDRTDTAEALEAADDLRKKILGQKETIERLVGMSADGHLGNKYEDRAEKIREGQLSKWQRRMLMATIVAVLWVVAVFACLQTNVGNEWANLGINLLKTSPAFFLMGFAFKQYTKERNLEEEYAFKAAVAMTINAYADLLAGQDKEDNKSRQELILNALKQVHSMPKLYPDKGGTLISLKTRELRDTMQTLTEVLRTGSTAKP